MEHPNEAHETEVQAGNAAQTESGAAPVTGPTATDYLLSFTKNASEEEQVILEQFANRKRHPRVTEIGKPYSAMEGFLFLLLCPTILFFGFLFIPSALPLLVAIVILLALMGIMRIANAKKQPCICPYCARFDDIPSNVNEYHCPSCKSESVRVGDELHPKLF